MLSVDRTLLRKFPCIERNNQLIYIISHNMMNHKIPSREPTFFSVHVAKIHRTRPPLWRTQRGNQKLRFHQRAVPFECTHRVALYVYLPFKRANQSGTHTYGKIRAEYHAHWDSKGRRACKCVVHTHNGQIKISDGDAFDENRSVCGGRSWKFP